MEIPEKQRMERQESLAREHNLEYRAALRRAVTLAVPHADSISSEYGTFDKTETEEEDEETEEEEEETESSASMVGEPSSSSVRQSYKRRRNRGVSWDELIESLFERDESGNLTFEKSDSRR